MNPPYILILDGIRVKLLKIGECCNECRRLDVFPYLVDTFVSLDHSNDQIRLNPTKLIKS